MKKFIISFFCLIFLLIFFIIKGLYSTEDVVLKFSTWGSASEMAILNPIIKEFENAHNGVRVEVLHIPQDYFQKLHLLFASNMEPDVMLINNQNIPIYEKFLCNLDGVFDKKLYFDKSIDCMSYNGKILAVPRDCSGLVVYYNKDIFDRYGVDYPKKTWNLNDLFNVVQKLSKNGTWGISYEPNLYYALPFVHSFGGGVFDDKGFVGESNSTKSGIKYYKDLAFKYHYAPTPSEVGSKTLAQMFLEGRIAMHLSGRWLTPKYRNCAKFSWDVVNFPDYKATNDATGWAISKRSKNKKLAEEFVLYLSSKKSIEKFSKNGLIVPARKDVANSKTFLDGKPNSSRIFIEAVENSMITRVDKSFNQEVDRLNEIYFNEAK